MKKIFAIILSLVLILSLAACAAAPAARMYGPRFCFGTRIPLPFSG